MKTLFRAMSAAEYTLLMDSGRFSFAEGGCEMKQFGLDLQETLDFARFQPDYAMIIRVKVPARSVKRFHVSDRIDPFIFRHGVLTVDGLEKLGLFNAVVRQIRDAY